MTDTTTLRTTMVDTQIRPSDVTKFPIIDAMLSVPREAFVPTDAASVAYIDGEVSYGGGRALMAPRNFAKMLDALDLRRSEVVLIVGTGLGYSAAVLSRMVDTVIAIEEDADLAKDAEATLAARGYDNVAVLEAGLTAGVPKSGPYDVVVIDGAIETLPDSLASQIADGGRVAAIVMDGAVGKCKIGHMSDGKVSWRIAFDATAPVLPGFAKETSFAL